MREGEVQKVSLIYHDFSEAARNKLDKKIEQKTESETLILLIEFQNIHRFFVKLTSEVSDCISIK